VRYERLVGIRQNYESVIPQLEQVSQTVSMVDDKIITPYSQHLEVPSKVVRYKRFLEFDSGLSHVEAELVATGKAIEGRASIVDSLPVFDKSLLDKEERLREVAGRLYSLDTQIVQCIQEQEKYGESVGETNMPERAVVQKYSAFCSAQADLSIVLDSLRSVEGFLVSEEASLKTASDELEKYKAEVGICPLCNTSFDSHKGGMHGNQ